MKKHRNIPEEAKSAKGTTALHPPGEASATKRATLEAAPSRIQRQQTT
jgi:hypothetical protein